MPRPLIRPVLVLTFLGLVGIIAVPADEKTKAPELPAKDFKGAAPHRVIRIVDGDTIEVQKGKGELPFKVRLIGVDTPETVHPSKPVEAYGKEASKFTTNLLKGEEVYLDYDQDKTDKYGRTLAYVYRAPDGLFVNLEIVRQGYGHAYTRFPFKYMDLFREHGKAAREAGRGLWGEATPVEGKDTKPDKIEAKTDAPKGLTVFVTNTGMKYHVEGCRYLSKSKIPISLENAKKRYGPCSVCSPPIK